MKITLQKSKRWPALATGRVHPVTAMKPFWQRTPGFYVHRPRSAQWHSFRGELSHIGITFWCGMVGSVSASARSGRLMDSVPAGEVVCATCEGRAVGAGITGAREINGQAVCFSPRRHGGDIPLPPWTAEEVPEIKIEIRRRDTGELIS